MELPILIIGYNRPHLLKKLLANPSINKNRIYIFIDGFKGEMKERSLKNSVEECQRIAIEFQKESKGSKLLIAESNLGCYRGVTTAIDWFFGEVEAGLILEDDLLPHPEIVKFCNESLKKFENYHEISSISCYRATPYNNLSGNYEYSSLPSSWGWATWRDRWKTFDHDAQINILDYKYKLLMHGGITGFRRWMRTIQQIREGKIDTWAYRWMFTNWMNSKMNVVAPINLIENIGFGDDATHTKNGKSNTLYPNSIRGVMDFSIHHVKTNKTYDNYLLQNIYGIETIAQTIKKRLR